MMRKINGWRFLVNSILIIIEILILLYPAIQNGYPLLYSDSATYIISGFDGTVPISRPILYCLLVRYISLSYSLWIVLVFQAGIFICLIWLTLNLFIKPGRELLYTLFISIFLGFFTGASNYISQIMPDVFAGFMIWAFALLLALKQRKRQWLLWSVVLFSSMVHFSNLLTVAWISIVAVALVFFFRQRIENIKMRLIQLSTIAVLPWLLIPSINYLFDGEFYLNKSSNIFFTGRLIETGILKDFFETVPESQKYSLHAVKDRLPEKAWQFLWNDDSPLYDGNCSQYGGWSNCWKVHVDEYGEMIRDALITPQLLGKFVQVSLSDWQKQLFDFDIGHLTPQGVGTAFDDIVPRYFDDSAQYKNSEQYSGTLFFRTESKIQRWVVGLSAFAILIMLPVFIRRKNEKLSFICIVLVTIMIGLLANSIVCSVFSGVLNRYQGRVIWLIPFVACIFIVKLIDERTSINN